MTARLSFRKDVQTALTTADDAPIRVLRVGVGWDVNIDTSRMNFLERKIAQAKIALGRDGVDLDVHATFFDWDGNGVRVLGPGAMMTLFGGAAKHSGNDQTGNNAHDGEPDEMVTIDFTGVPDEVGSIVFSVSAFAKKAKLSDVAGTDVTIDDLSGVSPLRRGSIMVPIDNATADGIVVGRANNHGVGNPWGFTPLKQMFTLPTSPTGLMDSVKRYGGRSN